MENQRNLILAIALSFLLLIGWDYGMQYFYPQPEQALVEDKADTPSEQAATQHSRTGGLVDPALQAREKAEVAAALLETVAKINAEIEKHARIGALIISHEPWSIENEVLTPTMKIRRDKVEERFGPLAETLARNAAQQGEVLIHWEASA